MMIGPELDLLEGGCRGEPAYRDPGGRVESALMWENTRSRTGQPMRWAGFSVTGNADYVSLLALRAHFAARGLHGQMTYQRYYQLVGQPRTVTWRSQR
jgi:hypothetical protein